MKFWKMHGLGNDYIVIDNRRGELAEEALPDLARKLCRRRFSVGSDGILLVYDSKAADAKMRIFNPDGSEAEMCGNGIRCFVKFCYENRIISKLDPTVETLAGLKRTWLTVEDGKVTYVKVDMGKPEFDRRKIPMAGEGLFIDQELKVDGETFHATALSVGNPHCVIFVDGVKDFPVSEVGPKIENHELFPNRVNVEFVEVISRKELWLRVWERGVGETLACGTGACASVVAAKTLNKVDGTVTVHLLGGDLEIEYSDRVFMSGPAEKVFEGYI